MKRGNEAVKTKQINCRQRNCFDLPDVISAFKRNKKKQIKFYRKTKHNNSVLQTKIINKQLNKQMESNNKNLKKSNF